MENGDRQRPGQYSGAGQSAPIRSTEECNRILQSAKFAFDRGQFEDARMDLERALDFMHRDPPQFIESIRDCYVDLIDIYMLLNRPQEALSACEALIQLEPGRQKDRNYIEIITKTAQACEAMGNLSAADAVYKEAALLAGTLLPLEDPLHNKLNTALVALHAKRNRDEALSETDKEFFRQVEQNKPMPGSRIGLREKEGRKKKRQKSPFKLPNLLTA